MERRLWRDFDWWLLFSVLALSIIGIFMIYSATFRTEELSDYWIRQSRFLAVGLVLMVVVALIDYRQLEILAPPVFLFYVATLLAVEFFLTKEGKWLINEVAPRPHNSGHHTIDSCVTSQFQQHLRAILNWPLGDTTEHQPAAMINLLGADGHTGPVAYEGMEDCLDLSDCHIHLYGKTQTRPFRKMGHATALGEDVATAIEKVRTIKNTLKIVSHVQKES